MKHKYLFKLFLGMFFLMSIGTNSQNTGDLAFIGFNADGDKDFSIAILANIPPNSTIYFSDKETDGVGGLTSGEGILTWSTGDEIINAGSVIIFTDIDNGSNLDFGVSIGSITRSGTFNLAVTVKDGLFAYLGDDADTPTIFIAAIQIGNDSTQLGTYDVDGITLTGTGLKKGTSIIIFDASATPDGAVYKGQRFGQTSFSNYYSLIADVENNWTNIVNGDGESLLPFSSEKFSIINSTWNGSTDNNWETSSNWTPATVPTNMSDILIPNDIINYPTIENTTTVKGITLASGSSLIANATVTGSVLYKRNITANWHLISVPVEGETIDNLINKHTFATGSAMGRIGIAPYKNDGTQWDYQTNSSEGIIEKGTGLSVKLATAGVLKFTGNINNTTINTPVTKNTNGYNLVGNPYTSYLNSATFLTENSGILTSQTIWIWNGTNYETKVTADAFIIAPAQGYFIEANTTGNISFNAGNQIHQTTDTFKRSSRPEVQITATSSTKTSSTKLYYINGTTTGFDNGYDGMEFQGITSNFSLATQLVSENSGKNYAIQSLPTDTMEKIVVPISLNAMAGNDIEFSASSMNLPNNIIIYLEDRINNTITNLSEESYTINLKNNSNGTGQFYIHTSSKNLENAPIQQELQNVSVYKSENNSITITGLQTEKTLLNIYSTLGTKIMSTLFKSTGVSIIQLPKMATGVYIIELNSDVRKVNKKIILK